jgi:hypothetical protein
MFRIMLQRDNLDDLHEQAIMFANESQQAKLSWRYSSMPS